MLWCTWWMSVGQRTPRVSRIMDSIQSKVLRSCLPGKATRGYDPSQDIIWLRSEITRWIEGNLVEKWYDDKHQQITVL